MAEAVGQCVWVEGDDQIDAVTAISGSGPAYVFYFVEAMERAAIEMGLSAEQGRKLAVETFRGAAARGRELGAEFWKELEGVSGFQEKTGAWARFFYFSRYATNVPANTQAPSQLLCRKAAKHFMRSRSRISV